MSKKISVVVALVGMCALSLFLLSCGSSSSRSSGLLYVLTQGSNGTGNNVSSFAIDLGSGGLSLINSNAPTCKTAGTCGLPLDIVLDPKGATAFVLNQGVPCDHHASDNLANKQCGPAPPAPPSAPSVAPTIYPYTVNSDGSLSSPGTPVLLSHPNSPTDNQDDADVAVTMVRDAGGQFLFVMNQGSNPPPANCQNDPLPQGNFDACPSISVFAMQTGSLTLKGGSPINSGSPLHLNRIPTGLSAITVGTPAEELLFVTSNHDLSNNHNDNTVSVYGVGSDGTLTEKIGSPYATSTINPLSVLAVNTNQASGTSGGVFVYVGAAGNASGAVDAFQVCTLVGIVGCIQTDVDNAKLLPIGTPTSTGQKPVGMVVDPTNNFLYVVCEDQSAVYGYRISSTPGTLTTQSPASLQTGSQPVALAIHSSGKFLYTSNSAANNISGFTLSITSGSMTTLPVVNSPAGPSGMAAR